MKFYYLALLPAKDKEFPYSIHGLWPQEGVHKWRACPKGGHTFDIERLHGLLSQLHADWHSSRGTDEHFWKHEWEKHGSCMQEQIGIDEFTFFNTTLQLFLENTKLLENCENDDCIVGCFDLDFKKINCE